VREIGALLAEGPTAGARTEVLALDVVTGVAVRVVVVDRLLDGVPRGHFGHTLTLTFPTELTDDGLE
jgi:hypothetical protein